jgi:membrane dipeptidase
MEEYNGYIQVFASFVDQKNISVSPMNHCLTLLRKLHDEIKQNKDKITLIQSAKDLETVSKEKKMGAILSLEGGEALDGNLSAIWMYHQLGVRLITLTWNWANELADGILESRGGGLTQFGKEAVAMMEQLGILIDVSHLSEQGFWDVAESTKKPFVASHSCVKALCAHPRNLTDAQISCLIQRRGGIGINFYPVFLSEDGTCGIEEILRHMEYILEMGGDDVLGIGSDFDGVSFLPEGMQGVQDIKGLILGMEAKGWDKKLQEKLLFSNFHRIFKETLQ